MYTLIKREREKERKIDRDTVIKRVREKRER